MAKDQIRLELKRLDPEITLELTYIRFQNDYSTLALRASGNYVQWLHEATVEPLNKGSALPRPIQHSGPPPCLQYPYFVDVVDKMNDVVTNSAQPNHAHALCLKIILGKNPERIQYKFSCLVLYREVVLF